MAKANRRFTAYYARTRMQRKMQQLCTDFINTTIHDPQTRAAVTPNYAWGCKRPIVASTFYPALNRPNVTLIPHAVTPVTKNGLIDTTGTDQEIDALTPSTEFQPQPFPNTTTIQDPNGHTPHHPPPTT